MSARHDDDRWSAYLDGELPPDEAARAARELALDPEAERLVGELRAVGEVLRRLPPLRLENQFPAQVLAAAERELLSEPKAGRDALAAAVSPRSSDVAAAEGNRAVPSAAAEPWGWSRVVRPLVWSGAAVAAALALMAFNPEPETSRTVAVHSEQAPETAALADQGPPVVGSWRATDEAAPDEALGRRLAKSGPAAGGAALDGADAAAGAADDTLGEPRLRYEGASPVSAGFAAAARNAPILAPASPAPAASAPPLSPGASGEPRLTSAAPLLAGDIPADVLVVHCDVTNAAAAAGAFEAVLARQQIPLEPAPAMPVGEADSDVDAANAALAESLDGAAAAETPSPNQVAADDPPPPPAEAETPSLPELAATRERRVTTTDGATATEDSTPAAEPMPAADALPATVARDAAGESPAGEVEVLYVEATPAQLEATLQALNAEPTQFLNVAVMPSPAAPEQQQYTQYNRAGPRADEPAGAVSPLAAEPEAGFRQSVEATAPQTAPLAQTPRAQRILRLRGRTAESPAGPAPAVPPSAPAERTQTEAGGENLRRALFVLRVLDPPEGPPPPARANGPER